jgi:thiamine-monophosphate kinase
VRRCAVTEFEIIRRYFVRAEKDPSVLIGIGDDGAVLDIHGPAVVAVDTLVAGVHFPEHTAADALGFRVLAVNLSDLAAMGAEPRWCTLALTLPAAEPAWLEDFARGLFTLAERFGVSLVGGDLTRGPLTATLQLIGTLPAGRALSRGGGQIGDDIYVTGSLGDAAAGLALLQQRLQADAVDPAVTAADNSALIERFLRPTPRVGAGLALARIAHAAIDISDGLVADLGHVCTASGCGAVVDVECLPLSAELSALLASQAAQDYALSGGDDYELCFTAAPAQAQRIAAALLETGTAATRIGKLTAGSGIIWQRGGLPFTPPRSGFRHF